MRVSHEQEVEGLDLSQHGEQAIGSSLLGLFRANGHGEKHAAYLEELASH